MSAKSAPFVDPTADAVDKNAAAKESAVSQAQDAAAKAEAEAAATRRQNTIDSLLVEREGYERTGKTERVKQVDDALKAAGYKAPSGRKSRDAETA